MVFALLPPEPEDPHALTKPTVSIRTEAPPIEVAILNGIVPPVVMRSPDVDESGPLTQPTPELI
jgi:hypothetical protein